MRTLPRIMRSFTIPSSTLRTRPGKTACGRGLPVATTCQRRCARLGKLPQSKSGQAPTEIKERQKEIQDKFNFFKNHIRRKGLRKSSAFKSPQRGTSVATVHDISWERQTLIVSRPASTLNQHTSHSSAVLPVSV